MKMVSMILLSLGLLLSNVALAEDKVKQFEIDDIQKIKLRILGGVSTHINILNKFKTCVEAVKTEPELGLCIKEKNDAVKVLNMRAKQAKQARDKQAGKTTNSDIKAQPAE